MIINLYVMSSNYSKNIYKDLGRDEEPVDFDFFDDGSSEKTKYHQSKNNKEVFSRSRSRAGTTPPGKQVSTSFSPRSADLESTRSAASNCSSSSGSGCLSVRLPTVSPSRNDIPSDESNDEDKECSLNQISSSVPSKSDLAAVGIGLDPKTNNIKTSKSLDQDPYHYPVKHERPKTSRIRPTTTTRPRPKPGSWSRTGDQSSDSGSYSSSFTSDSSYSCDSGPTSSDSDSDDNTDSGSVTDVSPLQSPNLPDNLKDFSSDYKKVQEKGGSKKTKFRHHSDGSTKKSKKESVRFEGVGLGVGINTPNVLGAPPGWNESEAQELSMLLKAVLEMDKTPKSLVQMPHTQSSRPTSAKSNLSTKSLPHKRMNMSFSNDRVRQIDRENQRLLQQIMNKSGVELQNTGVKSKSRRPFPSQSATSFNGNHQARLSHSALRRQRENRRIEIENMKILSRIDSTKPTREMTKEALLEDHYKLTGYGQQLAKTPLRRISAKSTSGKPSMSEASSLLSLYSNASSSKAGSKGRPIHTKKLGLEPPPRQPRPAWDDRW